jgi:hypothetical protein
MEANEKWESSRFEGKDNSFNTIKMRLDPAELLMIIEHSFLGEKWDPYQNKWIQSSITPMLSKEAVEDLMIELNARISIPSVLGNLSINRVNEITRKAGMSCRDFIIYNEGRYNIASSNWVRIQNIVEDNVLMYLSRSIDGLENRRLTEGLTTTETNTVNKQMSESGAAATSVIHPFGGRR